MHAFLICGNNPTEKIAQLAKEKKTKVLEFNLQKVEDIKELQSFTKLTLQEPTAILIRNIDMASSEAQNAFLKDLEEPQKNLMYFLTTKSENSVIPTIVSRCQLIVLNNSQLILNNSTQEFLEASESEKLTLISDIKDRGEAVDFVTNLILTKHQKLTDVSDAEFIEKAQKTLNALQGNGNVQLQLLSLVVNLN